MVKNVWNIIKEDVGYIESFIYTMFLVERCSVPPYCEHVGRRMVCLFCPEHVIEKRDNCTSSYCIVAYTKRLQKERQATGEKLERILR